MPLRVTSDAGDVQAFKFDSVAWAALKLDYRSLNLRTPCCGSPAIPKTSTLGNFFFAHARKGECTTAPESAEHIYCKQLIAQAAQSAGWTVTTERPGMSPAGEVWIADVFCEKGSAQLALEVQMSPQPDEETVRRQLRYKASGVRGAWFFGSKARRMSVVFDKETPAFSLAPIELGKEPMVQRFDVALSEFVTAMLNKRLAWVVPEFSQPLQVEFLPDTCWACKLPVKQVFGYFECLEDTEEWWEERAFSVASLAIDLEKLQAVISNEELVAAGLNPIGRQYVIHGKVTKWPQCNLCLHCGAPQNNFHIGEKLRADFKGNPVGYVVPDEGELDNWKNDAPEQSNGLMPIPRIVKGSGQWEIKAISLIT